MGDVTRDDRAGGDGEVDSPIIVRTASGLATAMHDVEQAGRRWQVVGVTRPDDTAVALSLQGRLAQVTVVGDGMVEVGGGVTLASLSQYVQSQLGYAPGWPVTGSVTVAGVLADTVAPPAAVAAIVMAMSKAVVEVEVMRASTQAAELWDRGRFWSDGTTVGLPADAVVVRATFSVVAAAAAVAEAGSGDGSGSATGLGDLGG